MPKHTFPPQTCRRFLLDVSTEWRGGGHQPGMKGQRFRRVPGPVAEQPRLVGPRRAEEDCREREGPREARPAAPRCASTGRRAARSRVPSMATRKGHRPRNVRPCREEGGESYIQCLQERGFSPRTTSAPRPAGRSPGSYEDEEGGWGWGGSFRFLLLFGGARRKKTADGHGVAVRTA